MERFNDDVLGLILNGIPDPNDRKSFSQVCKQWLKVEGLTRFHLRVFEPHLLFNFIPRFPNLLVFKSSQAISNAQIEFLVKKCPKLEVLNLNLNETYDYDDELPLGLDDIDDSGICAVAMWCSKISEVFLRRRCQIGNVGVVSLVNLSKNLIHLDLGRCSRINDEALEAIGASKSLQCLNLCGCSIADSGLASLASGPLSKTLRKLNIAECDQITNHGVLYLKQMRCLEELSLAECGPKVTDIGGMAIAAIHTLKQLNLSWLINVSDATVLALAQGCKDLMEVDFKGCELITGVGIRAFANHEYLEVLGLARCVNFNGADLEQIVLGCQTLRYIKVDRWLRMWIPLTLQENPHSSCRFVWI